MLPIFIPTLNRAHLRGQQTTRQRALRNLPQSLRKYTTLVVDPVDHHEHRRDYRDIVDEFGCKLAVVEGHRLGIALTRHYIGKFLAKNKFVMVDDDLRFYHRLNGDHKHLYKNSEEDTEQMFEDLEAALDKYAHVAISARQFNNAETNKPDFRENKRAIRVLAFRRKEFLSVEHGRVDIMEDFDVTLQLLRKGYPNLVFYKWSQDQYETQEVGGCSTYRTRQLHDASVRKMAQLHADFIKLVEKKDNRAGGDFGTRLEAQIKWEKAYESSKSTRFF